MGKVYVVMRVVAYETHNTESCVTASTEKTAAHLKANQLLHNKTDSKALIIFGDPDGAEILDKGGTIKEYYVHAVPLI